MTSRIVCAGRVGWRRSVSLGNVTPWQRSRQWNWRGLSSPAQEQNYTLSLRYFEDKSAEIRDLTTQIEGKITNRKIREQLKALNEEIAKPDLWDNPENAGKISQKQGQLANILNLYDHIETERLHTIELASMAIEDDAQDPGNVQVLKDCDKEMQSLVQKTKRFHLEMMLDGPADNLGCYIEVLAGAGGNEACDFAEMLLGMYTKWATANGYSATLTESSPGSSGGLKAGLLHVEGLNAYGWTKMESGVHRMVRISEYDAQKRRHTAFARVAVLPAHDENDESFDIPASDIKIETFRAGGAGGQHVNTTDSAVRVTHIPTGITASCQKERSQHQNKKMALQVLKARVVQVELEKGAKEKTDFISNLGENTWGNQIRSYVLHPYKLVKDHRTQHETSMAEAVLQGDPDYLNPFMEALLRQT